MIGIIRDDSYLGETIGMKSLVLDDEFAQCEIISSVLAMSHISFELFQDPVEALAALGDEGYDVAFIDIGLPNMNGLEFAKHFKEKCPHADIVFITGAGDYDQAVEAIKLGAHDFVRKPFRLSEIEACIARIVEKRQLHDSHRRTQIREFANEMSMELMHELRNPLAAIGGFSKRAYTARREDRFQDYAKIIFDQSLRAEKALNEVLAHLKLDGERKS